MHSSHCTAIILTSVASVGYARLRVCRVCVLKRFCFISPIDVVFSHWSSGVYVVPQCPAIAAPGTSHRTHFFNTKIVFENAFRESLSMSLDGK